MSRRLVAVVVAVSFLFGGVGGWFGHSVITAKNYEKAWTAYEQEVKAWKDIDGRRDVLTSECEELASVNECNDLEKVGKNAEEATKDLLNLKKSSSVSVADLDKLKAATNKIRTQRKEAEKVVVKVEESAEALVAEKFLSTVEEAKKKASEASSLAAKLIRQVKDEATLSKLTAVSQDLSSACEKWNGEAPSGREGVQEYLALKRLMRVVDDATAEVNRSHEQWQVEGASKDQVIAGMLEMVNQKVPSMGLEGIDPQLINDYAICIIDKSYDSMSIATRNAFAAVDYDATIPKEEDSAIMGAADNCAKELKLR